MSFKVEMSVHGPWRTPKWDPLDRQTGQMITPCFGSERTNLHRSIHTVSPQQGRVDEEVCIISPYTTYAASINSVHRAVPLGFCRRLNASSVSISFRPPRVHDRQPAFTSPGRAHISPTNVRLTKSIKLWLNSLLHPLPLHTSYITSCTAA
jgi:hypothetical protein